MAADLLGCPGRQTLALLFTLAVFGLGSVAEAHIEAKPKKAPAGERVTVKFDVENESDTAGTRKIDIQLPEGITSISPKAVRGWKVKLRRSGSKLERLVFTAPPGREIPAGDTHRAFSFVMALPARPGTTLEFKALQTYEDGTVQRWIGPASAEEPAPRLRLTAAPRQAEEEPQAPAVDVDDRPDADDDDDDDDDSGWVIPVVIGGVVVAGGLGALLVRRRRRSP